MDVGYSQAQAAKTAENLLLKALHPMTFEEGTYLPDAPLDVETFKSVLLDVLPQVMGQLVALNNRRIAEDLARKLR